MIGFGSKIVNDYPSKLPTSVSSSGPYLWWAISGYWFILANAVSVVFFFAYFFSGLNVLYMLFFRTASVIILGAFIYDWLLITLVNLGYDGMNFNKTTDLNFTSNNAILIVASFVDLALTTASFWPIKNEYYRRKYTDQGYCFSGSNIVRC